MLRGLRRYRPVAPAGATAKRTSADRGIVPDAAPNAAPSTPFDPRTAAGLGAGTDAGSPALRPQGLVASSAWVDLMAQMSHDLRTPLNAVIGFSDVMRAELLGPVGHPRYREYAGDIGESGRRLLKTAEDTLAMTTLLAQSARSVPEIVEVSGVIREVWGYGPEEAVGRGITLGIEAFDAADIEVLAPAQAFRQIVVNLLTEAIARAPDDGRIVLRAVAEDETVRLEILVPCARPRPTGTTPSLAVGLARTMLELQGAGLIEITSAEGTWRAVTVLDRPVQQDFFAGYAAASAPRQRAVAS